jgi:hypothetical protein
MGGRLMQLCRWFAPIALTCVGGPVFAQVGCPYPPTPECQTLQRIDEDRRRAEADAAARRREEDDASQRERDAQYEAERRRSGSGGYESSRQQADMAAAIQALRTRLLAAPALPADRNPLLGRWRLAGGKRPQAGDELSQLIGILADPSAAMCGVVFGEDTTTEFRAGSWAAIDGSGDDSLGPTQYRLESKRLYVLPDRGVPLLGFELIDGNTIREIRTPDCVLVRVGTTSGPVPSQSPAARPTPGVCRKTLLDQLGTARIEQARQVISERFAKSIDGKVPNKPDGLRIDAWGSACDDSRVKASLYDFDASGVLRSITYAWSRPPGPAPAPIFSERVATLSRFHALPPPQSTGRLEAVTSLGRLVLEDMPGRNLLLEAYIAR